MANLTVACPTCQRKVAWKIENTYRPFCSKRCQLIDLGEWADEKNYIASSEESVLHEYEQDNA